MSGATDAVSRLERSQWIALLALVGLTAVLFGALALLWLDLSPRGGNGRESSPATRQGDDVS